MKQTQALITNSQAQVIALMITTDLTNKGIGAKLCISEQTVKFHITRINKALGTKNRAGLTLAWYRQTLSYEALSILKKYVPKHNPEIEFITENEFLKNIANQMKKQTGVKK